MFGEIIYDVVSAGSGGHAIMRTRFGRTEFCGSDGYWTRSPDYVTPFVTTQAAGVALAKLQGDEGGKSRNDKQAEKQLRRGNRRHGAATHDAAGAATTVIKPSHGGAGRGV